MNESAHAPVSRGASSVDKFRAEPTSENLRVILTESPQEWNNLDFKAEWIEFDKLARHLLALANSGGGLLVLGVRQISPGVYDAIGLSRPKDKSDVFKRTKPYLPDGLEVLMTDFRFDEGYWDPNLQGKVFQVLAVSDRPTYAPFVSMAEGASIRKNAIYVRKGTESIEADYYDLQAILNRRIETAYSTKTDLDLQHHLSELKLLYKSLVEFDTMFSYDNYPGHSDMMVSDLEIQGNHFVRELIEKKEELIRSIAGRQPRDPSEPGEA